MKVKIGIIGGSGLDNPDILKNRTEKTITTIFGSPSDALIEGEIEGVPCVLLARHGRKHTIMPGNVNYRANVWALKEAGCTHLVVTTATGSLQEHINRGDFVILDSFIDRTQSRKQTFYDGEPNSPVGVCHIQMEPAFCQRTRQIIIEAAKELGLPFHETGTVVAIEGPRFSSKAESLMFRQWGGHVINMTTVPEVVLAKEAGLCYAAIALATDYDCWKVTGEKVCVGDVMATFQQSVPKVINLITKVVPRINAQNWDTTINELKETSENSVMLPH
ncbi:hypothetical protein PPYR_01035 [Photinus pyralis]|uniref:S-methyl-5'-thioadenosine phosphorylase n=1 Tax=Photinus pyralis TaxID=7054 RepID=A0A1Y1MEH6_PHOPY|nr:S-methyl-5'-thioadenosine phosphorylase [Photinus pyralis]KAB0804065.1 hypothetical protein PPYR_01035 [Photinus pyralis]